MPRDALQPLPWMPTSQTMKYFAHPWASPRVEIPTLE